MARTTTKRWLASDGYPIHIRRWAPDDVTTPRGLVIVLHGVQSHEGWYHGLGARLADSGYLVVFPDRRGSGANQRDRGDTPSADRLFQDIVELAQDLRGEHLELRLALIGISWGGKLAVVTAARHLRLIDAVALVCPGLQPRVGVTPRDKLQIGTALLTRPSREFPIPLSDPALFTASAAAQRFIAEDPLSLRQATARLLVASNTIDRKVTKVQHDLVQPILLMLAGQDRIVDNARTRAYFAKLASERKQIIEYPEAHHTLEFEPDPGTYASDLASWLDHALEPPAAC